jgi:hypothetical protein
LTIPFHNESDKTYHACLGLYIATWSAAEHGIFYNLKTLSLITRKEFHTKPIRLQRKFELFLQAFDHPWLSEEKQEAHALIGFFKDEAQFRDSLVHGINARLLKPQGDWFAQQWLPERNEEPTDQNILVVDQQVLEKHYHDLGHAMLCMMGLGTRVLDIIEQRVSEAETSR